MSTVHMTIENITENFPELEDAKVYSVIDNMKCYRVKVVDGVVYDALDQEGNLVEDRELADTLIDQVIEFEKGE